MAQVRKNVNLADGVVVNDAHQRTIWQVLLDGQVPIEAFCEHVRFVAKQMQETSVTVGLLAEVMRDFSRDED